MVPTFGLTHVAFAVRDLVRSSRFYERVLGVRVVYREPHIVQLQTPGMRDVLVLEEAPDRAGPGGGIAHFGFRLTDPGDIDRARIAVEAAGGTIREQGEFVPGEPYLFAMDPDGYEIEIWYELPTRLDPPMRPASSVARRGRRSATTADTRRHHMTAADFRHLALALPEATEAAHMGHPDFRVRGKIFATLGYPSAGWGVVKLTTKQQQRLVGDDPDTFVPAAGAWGRQGMTSVRLKDVPRAVVRKALYNAWCNTAPKSLVRTATATRP